MSFPTREQVLALIEEHAPERLRQVLADNLRPAIGIITHEAEDASIAIGASKIGGAPDVPLGFEWPMWKGQPLGFVAQFNLEEVAAFDVEHVLPESGTLSFFYAIEEQPEGEAGDEGAWRVFWWPREVPLERRALPFEVNRFNALRPCALEFWLKWQVDSFILDSGGSFEERQRISHALYELPGEPQPSEHQFIGQAIPVQNPAELDVHQMFEGESMGEDEDPADYYERLLSGGLKWRLLFQLDSQFEPQVRKCHWMWGDAGMIYFCIHRDDLAARRFDKVWLQLQCG